MGRIGRERKVWIKGVREGIIKRKWSNDQMRSKERKRNRRKERTESK